MASPFSVFRKNQKVWMAGITIMAIGAFVFLTPTMMTSFNASAGRDMPKVKTTKFGNLGQQEFQMQLANRRVFMDILQGIANTLVANKQNPFAVNKVAQVIGPATEEDVIKKWLFAREAEAMGIRIDDKTLNTFIDALTNQSIGRDGILEILRHVRQGVSEASFLA